MATNRGDKLVFTYSKIIDKKGWKDVKPHRTIFSVAHTRVYNDALIPMAALKPCSRILLLFLADNMNQEGIVYNNKVIRDKFLEYMYNAQSGEAYTDGTVNVAFSELRKKSFLIEISRGIMYINPVYIWRGDESSRIKACKDIFKDKFEGLKIAIDK